MEDQKEIDKDLTMLKPDKEPNFAELFENSKGFGPSEVETSQEALDAQVVNSTVKQGNVDELDDFGSLFESTNQTRARNQSEGIKGIKAIGGGIYQGALIALEQLGYVADLDTYTNMFKETEDLSGNFWTRAFKDAQEAGRESDMFKIYEDDADQNSIMSQIFKWSSLEGAVSSSIGFGLSGLGAASLVSKLGSLGKFAKLGALTDEVLGLAGGTTKAITGPLASSMTSNYFMGQMMATDTYNQSMEVLRAEGKIGEGEGQMSELDAQKIAANNAQEVVGLNMALVATSYLKFGNIFKRTSKFNAKIKNPTTMAQLKELIVKGSPTAMIENVYQEMIQMEQIYDTSKETGIVTDYSNDYWDRMSQLALSDRALHAGALGVAGGPIQFAIIQKPLMREQLKQQKEAYNNQESANAWGKTLVENRVDTFKRFQEASDRALVSVDPEASILADDMSMIEEIAHHTKWGQLDFFRKDVENALEMTPEQAKELGYDDNYKETAQELLDTIDSANAYSKKYYSLENYDTIVYNRLMSDRVLKDYSILQEKIIGIESKAMAVISTLYPEYVSALDENLNIKRDPKRFEGLSDVEVTKLRAKELKDDAKIAEILQTIPEFSELLDIKKKQAKRTDLYKKLNKNYEKLISSEYQRNYIKKEKQNVDNIVQNAKDKTKKDTLDKIEKETSFRTLEDVIADKGTEKQQVKRAKNLEEFNATPLQRQGIKQGETFTSIDKNKNKREFSPDDLLRSVDGRYFRVKGQNYAAKMKGGLKFAANPLIYETDAFGKGNSSALIELTDHSFLRPEIKQITVKGKKKFYNSKDSWGPYMEVDSILKPNNFLFEEAKRERATLGEVITVRNLEYQNNRAKTLEPTPGSEQFNFTLANAVQFEGDYVDIEIRPRLEGDGNNFLDVYVGDQKVSRLDRQSNINYDAVIRATKKGPVTGRIVSKYTSKSNLVQILDDEGNPIRSSLSEMKNMKSEYLPNGKVYIAQTPGNTSSLDLAPTTLSETGEVIDGNILEVTKPDGTVTPVEIPYESMTPGDTYALILTPAGRLMPVALRTEQIVDLKGKDGQEGTYVNDIIEDIIDSVDNVFGELTEDESEFDANLKKEIAESGNKTDAEIQKEFTQKKRDFVNSKFKEQIAEFNENVFKHFRSNTFKYINIGNVDGTYEFATDTNSNGRRAKILNPGFFTVGVGLDSNNKLSPFVRVKNDDRILERVDDKGNSRSDNFKYIHLSENPQDFKVLISQRMRKISLREMQAADATTAKDIIFNQGLTSDINIAQPFAGTSLTIRLDGKDIQDEGAKAAENLESKFKKYKQNPVSAEITDETIQRLEDTLSFNDDADIINLNILADSENLEELIEAGKDIIRESNLSRSNRIIAEFTNFMNEEITEANHAEIADMASMISEAGITDADNGLAKLGTFIQNTVAKIKDGTYKVTNKPAILRANPDGDIFKKGVVVYNTVYGKVTVHSYSKDRYTFKDANGKVKTIFPHQTFTLTSKYTELHKIKKSMEKLDEKSAQYEVLEAQKTRLENQLFKKDPKTKNTSDQDSDAEVEFSEVNDESLEKTLKIFGSFTEDNSLPLDQTLVKDVFKAFNTNRGNSFIENIASISELKERLISKYSDEKVTDFTPINESDVESIFLTLKDSFMYSQETLDGLKALASSGKATQDNDANLLDALQKYVDYLKGDIPNKQSILESTSISTGGRELKRKIKLLGKDSNKFEEAMKTLTMQANFLREVFAVEVRLKELSSFVDKPKIPSKPKKPTANKKVTDAKEDAQDTFTDPVVDTDDGINPMNTTADKLDDSSTISEGPFKGFAISEEMNEVLTKWLAENPIEGQMLLTVAQSGGEFVLIEKAKELSKKSNLSKDGKYKKGMFYRRPSDSTKWKFDGEFFISEDGGVDLTREEFEGRDGSDLSDALDSDNYNDPLFKKGDNTSNSIEDFNEELRRVSKMLPQLKLEVIENVAEMVNKFGVSAIGAYNKGVLYLVNNAKKGTGYHEVFHGVADLYLNPTEKATIAKEYGQKEWNTALEEKIADDFAEYVNNRSTLSRLTDAVKRFFQQLMNWKNNSRSSDVTSKVFRDIANGKYAQNINIGKLNNLIVDTGGMTIETLKSGIIPKDRVTLQKLIEKGNIKIVC